MKKTTLSKIFGVAVAIALLASLIVAAVPVSALTVQPLTISNYNISAVANYTIPFTGALNLIATDTLTVVFPFDTSFAPLAIGARAVGDEITVATATVINTFLGDATLRVSINGAAPVAVTAGAGPALAANDVVVVTTAGTVSAIGTATGSVFTGTNAALATGARALNDSFVITTGVAANTLLGDATLQVSINSGASVAVGAAVSPAFAAGDNVVVTTAGSISALGGAAGLVYTTGINFSNGVNSLNEVTGLVVTSAARQIVMKANQTATIGNAWTIKVGGVSNPSAPGSYSLTVASSKEPGPATSSSPYNIGVPTVVSSYNAAGNFVGSNNTLTAALAGAQTNFTLKLSPGTYAEIAPSLNAAVNHVMITTTGTAANTVIAMPPGPSSTLTLGGATSYVTVDNITINGQIVNGGNNNTIQNCFVNFPGGPGALVLVTNTGSYFTMKNSTIDETSAGNTTADVGIAMNDAGAGAPPFSAITNVTFKLNQSRL